MRTAALSLRPVVRSIRWGPLVGAGVAGAALVWLMGPDRPNPTTSLSSLRLAAVLLCAGAAFALDDQAADTLAPSPTTLLARRGLRVAVVVASAGLLWAALRRLPWSPLPPAKARSRLPAPLWRWRGCWPSP